MALAASNYRTLAGVVFAEPLEDQVALLDWVDAHVGWPRQGITWATPAVGCSRRCWPNAIPTGSTGRSRCAGRLVASAPSSTSPWTSPSRSGPCWPQAATWSLCASPTPMPPRRGWTRSSRARSAPRRAAPGSRSPTPWPTWCPGQGRCTRAPTTSPGRSPSRRCTTLLSTPTSGPRCGRTWSGGPGATRRGTPVWTTAASSTTPASPGWSGAPTTGRIRVPVLALHATGDGAAVPEHERRYAQQVRHAGDQDLLRQLFTERGGHCAFTPSELIVTIQALRARLQTGRWPATGPADLNAAARALGPQFQVALDWGVTFQPRPADPAFVTYEPGRLPRPFPPAA